MIDNLNFFDDLLGGGLLPQVKSSFKDAFFYIVIRISLPHLIQLIESPLGV
jgi:hypothetical protein